MEGTDDKLIAEGLRPEGSARPAIAAERGACARAGAPAPLSVTQKGIYATGDVVEGGINAAQATFFLFYLTGVCGLSGSQAGAALFVTLLVDALVDPFVGYFSDKLRSPLGRRHPLLLGAALPLGAAAALLFNMPRSLHGGMLFGYVVAVLLFQRVLQSSFLLPYAAIGAEMSRDYRERSSVGAFRALFNGFGALIVTGLGFGVFMRGPGGLLDHAAYGRFGAAIGAVVAIFALICGIGTLPLRNRLEIPLEAQDVEAKGFFQELGEAARNRSFATLFCTIIVFWVAQGTAITLSLYAYKYFWDAPNELLQLIPAATMMGALTGVPIAALMLRRMEKQQVCVAGVLLYCLAQFAPATLYIAGALPATRQFLYPTLLSAALLLAWAAAAIGVSFLSMMADCADEHEHLFGARREALFFAGMLFSTKASIALGSLFGGVALDAIGFPRQVAKLGPHPHIATETVRNLGLITGPGAAAVAVLCIFILSRYSLDRPRLEAIQADLAERRRIAARA
jgi:GPH family glycoside/pentoside/hexuronide:cation symporter